MKADKMIFDLVDDFGGENKPLLMRRLRAFKIECEMEITMKARVFLNSVGNDTRYRRKMPRKVNSF